MTLAEALVADIVAGLRQRADPERAGNEKRYLKSPLEHWGVGIPTIRSVTKAALRRHPGLTGADVTGAAEMLWAEPVFDRRAATVELLDTCGGLLEPTDMALLERLLRESRTWALVDSLAASVVGRLVDRHPELGDTLDRWAADPDFWIRRSALLALLLPLRRGDGDPDRFFRYADAMLHEREFFIRKAIGWVLRDTAKKRPDLVFAWVLPRAARLSGVTLREVRKPLPDPQRQALEAARRA